MKSSRLICCAILTIAAAAPIPVVNLVSKPAISTYTHLGTVANTLSLWPYYNPASVSAFALKRHLDNNEEEARPDKKLPILDHSVSDNFHSIATKQHIARRWGAKSAKKKHWWSFLQPKVNWHNIPEVNTYMEAYHDVKSALTYDRNRPKPLWQEIDDCPRAVTTGSQSMKSSDSSLRKLSISSSGRQASISSSQQSSASSSQVFSMSNDQHSSTSGSGQSSISSDQMPPIYNNGRQFTTPNNGKLSSTASRIFGG